MHAREWGRLGLGREQRMDYLGAWKGLAWAERLAPWLLLPALVRRVLLPALAPLVCRVRGHRWVDDGHAGPDTAWESHDCARCGKGWHHTWY